LDGRDASKQFAAGGFSRTYFFAMFCDVFAIFSGKIAKNSKNIGCVFARASRRVLK
jgi:hypothetical protein